MNHSLKLPADGHPPAPAGPATPSASPDGVAPGLPAPPAGRPGQASALPDIPPTGSAGQTPVAGVNAAASSGKGSPPRPATGLHPLAAAMSEAELEEQIRDVCEKFGILRFHVRMSKGTTAGLPDDILIGPRGILWRECKNQTYDPTPAQVKTGEALTAIGQDFDIWRPEDWYSQRITRELAAISRLAVRSA